MPTGWSYVVVMPIALGWVKIHQPTFLSSWSTIESKFTTTISFPWVFNFNGMTVSKHIKSKTYKKLQNWLTSKDNDNSFSTGSHGYLQRFTRHHKFRDLLSELWVNSQDLWLEISRANEDLCSEIWANNDSFTDSILSSLKALFPHFPRRKISSRPHQPWLLMFIFCLQQFRGSPKILIL